MSRRRGRGGNPFGRGRGPPARTRAGRELLDLHLRRLAGLGARTVFLEVDEHNAAAIKLYARAGFREVSRRANYYRSDGGQSTDALVLRRDFT